MPARLKSEGSALLQANPAGISICIVCILLQQQDVYQGSGIISSSSSSTAGTSQFKSVPITLMSFILINRLLDGDAE